ncbi:MAG TPA: protein kinase, partial [Pseudomonadota bacterium]|nr:protein kinase [Pseudomonadota bacterium]
MTTQSRETGPTLEGRFKIGKIIGRGPSGVVYSGTDTQTGQPCAVKRLHAHFYVKDVLARVKKDALAAAALGHPAILAPYHVGQEMTGTLFLVCRFVQGESLAMRLHRGPLSFTATLAILDPLCAALQMAHDSGIAHGGITPANVISVTSGRVVLTDFGMCHLRGTPKIKWGGAVGYAAPETLQDGAALCSPRGDVFALGALVYECLTGQRMFTSTSVAAFIASVQNPPRLGASQARYEHLDAVLEMACAPQPDERFATPAALWRALQASLLDNSENEPAEADSSRESEPVVTPVVVVESKPNPAPAPAPAPTPAPALLDETSFADLKLDDDLIGGTDPMGLPPNSRPPKRSTAKPGTLPSAAQLQGAQAKPAAAEANPSLPAAKATETSAPLPGTRAPVRAIDIPIGESSADLHPVSLPPPPSLSAPVRDAPRNLEPMRAAKSGPTSKAGPTRAQEDAPVNLHNIPASGRTLRPISALPANTAVEAAASEHREAPASEAPVARPAESSEAAPAKPAARAPQHSPVPLPPAPAAVAVSAKPAAPAAAAAPPA